jgi:hypothetical protein
MKANEFKDIPICKEIMREAERRVATDILNIIDQVCFSKEYLEFRVGRGSNGQRDLIIRTIQDRYNVI